MNTVAVGMADIGGVFPVWALLLLIGIGLSILVYFTSVDYEKPKYHWVSKLKPIFNRQIALKPNIMCWLIYWRTQNME